RPAAARHRALADSEQREPDDQPGPDRSQEIAEPGAAIGPRREVGEQIDDDEEEREKGRDLEPAIAAITQEALMRGAVPESGVGCPPASHSRSAPLSHPRHGEKFFRRYTYSSTRRTCANAGRPTLDTRTHVAFDGFFWGLRTDPAVGPFMIGFARARPSAEKQP